MYLAVFAITQSLLFHPTASYLSLGVVPFNPCLGNYILSCARQWSHLNYPLQLIPVPCHFFGLYPSFVVLKHNEYHKVAVLSLITFCLLVFWLKFKSNKWKLTLKLILTAISHWQVHLVMKQKLMNINWWALRALSQSIFLYRIFSE